MNEQTKSWQFILELLLDFTRGYEIDINFIFPCILKLLLILKWKTGQMFILKHKEFMVSWDYWYFLYMQTVVQKNC